MWTFIILGFIAFFGTIIAFWISDGKYFSFIEAFPVALGVLLISILFSLIISVCIPAVYEEKFTDTEIVSIQDNMQTNGSFFLGSGSIDGTMKYVFYCKKGNYHWMEMVDYDNAEIVFTDKAPKVRCIYYKRTNAFINNFSLGFNKPMKKYVFFVPNGSIKNNYSLDSK